MYQEYEGLATVAFVGTSVRGLQHHRWGIARPVPPLPLAFPSPRPTAGLLGADPDESAVPSNAEPSGTLWESLDAVRPATPDQAEHLGRPLPGRLALRGAPRLPVVQPVAMGATVPWAEDAALVVPAEVQTGPTAHVGDHRAAFRDQ